MERCPQDVAQSLAATIFARIAILRAVRGGPVDVLPRSKTQTPGGSAGRLEKLSAASTACYSVFFVRFVRFFSGAAGVPTGAVAALVSEVSA
jgi:hypothetical protein